MNILILSTGSVSAHLSHKLAVELEKGKHNVKHYATEAAQMLINAQSDKYTTLAE